MTTPIPEHARDLLDRPLLMTIATTLKDGQIQLTPVWFNFDAGYVYFNSQKGRLKDRVLRERPGVSLLIVDPDNTARWLAIRGAVIEIADDIGHAHIDALAKRYMGVDRFDAPPEAERVRYKIEPRVVSAAEMYIPVHE
jgi:PPOX class probable F420-dependent enzyme